ncbi:EamA family transporter [Tessaracoccus sp. SD287]|nr:EamA family transporter [Tessaracoccus sp. SD287]
MVMGSCLSLQFGAALATQLFPVAGAWGVTSVRLVAAALILLVVVRPRTSGWTARTWRWVVLFGLSLGAMNGFFYAAVERLPLGVAVTLEFLGPLTLSAVLSRRPRDLLWVVMALGGVALLGLDGFRGETPLDPLGVLFALVAATLWAIYILLGARVGAMAPGQGPLAVAMAVGALAMLPLGAQGAVALFADPVLVVLAIGTGLLGSVVPYSLEFAALRRLPRHVFGILLSLEPGFAALVGALLLGQWLGVASWVAVLLVTAASIGATAVAERDKRVGRRPHRS